MISATECLVPFAGQRHRWYRAFAMFSACDYDQAVDVIMELRPIPFRAHAYLAASYGHLGRIDEAHNELSILTEAHNSQLRMPTEQVQ